MAKKIRMRPFAPNGLLTDKQAEMLKAWYGGENRKINTRDLADKIGVSRTKLYNSFKINPEKPFDELQLKIVNRMIEVFNEDIQIPEPEPAAKEKKKNEEEKAKKNAKSLIEKVSK